MTEVSQDAEKVTATFDDGSTTTSDLMVGSDGINSAVKHQLWPEASPRRWTEVVCYRGLIPRAQVAALRKLDGSPLDHNPIDSFSMDSRKDTRAWAMTYWVRGGELLNVWLAYYEPDSREFTEDWGDWRPIENSVVMDSMERAYAGDPRKDDIVALASAIEKPTKWGLYDRDALEHWQDGRICLLGDAAHPMLPTFGQGAAQSFEDGAALSSCFKLHGNDVYSALLHYERVRHYRATRFQFMSKFAFKHLEPVDSPERRKILAAVNERDYPIFDHETRAGDDDAWIYNFDARNVGDKLPLRKLGPWDFRSREAASELKKEASKDLWTPKVSLKGDYPVTRAELAQHTSFEDCWIIIRGKVYDISEWKDRHPGGPFVARMFGGKDASAEFGDYHSPGAYRHMSHFCVGPLID